MSFRYRSPHILIDVFHHPVETSLLLPETHIGKALHILRRCDKRTMRSIRRYISKTLNIVHIVHLNQTNQQQPQQKSHNPHPLTQTPSKTSSKTPAITNHHRRESIPLINSIAFSKIFFTSDFVTPISFKVL